MAPSRSRVSIAVGRNGVLDPTDAAEAVAGRRLSSGVCRRLVNFTAQILALVEVDVFLGVPRMALRVSQG